MLGRRQLSALAAAGLAPAVSPDGKLRALAVLLQVVLLPLVADFVAKVAN
jgi:hypothetical protein